MWKRLLKVIKYETLLRSGQGELQGDEERAETLLVSGSSGVQGGGLSYRWMSPAFVAAVKHTECPETFPCGIWDEDFSECISHCYAL